METHLIVSITFMSQDVYVLDCSLNESFSSLTPKFMKCSHNIWPSFFAWTTIFKWKSLIFRDKALIKSYFLPKCPGICRNICLICACHRLLLFIFYSSERNSNKFLLTTRFPLVQSYPILMGWLWTTLVVFIWQKCMRNELVVFAFGKERL